MSSFFFAAREARTTVDCPECGAKLDIKRSCHEAYMACSVCGRQFPLADFIAHMDDAMEAFLERLFVDRV